MHVMGSWCKKVMCFQAHYGTSRVKCIVRRHPGENRDQFKPLFCPLLYGSVTCPTLNHKTRDHMCVIKHVHACMCVFATVKREQSV